MTDIRVLVVDDSAVVRRVVGDIIKDAPGLTLVGTAVNGVDGLKQVNELRPDVMTLDLEMPLMNGLDVLSALQEQKNSPPVVVVSSLTRKGSAATLEALSRGAADYVCKPTSSGDPRTPKTDLRTELVERLLVLGAKGQEKKQGRQNHRDRARTERPATARPTAPAPTTARERVAERRRLREAEASSRSKGKPVLSRNKKGGREPLTAVERLAERSRGSMLLPKAVVIGSSTGGPAALEKVFSAIKAPLSVPVFIVQHIPAEFSTMLAKRLDSVSGMHVVEAESGQIAEAGTVYLAPGGRHLVLKKVSERVTVKLTDDPQVNSCRPAVDVLFDSAAEVFGARQLAVILTGMGQDGLNGCKKLAQIGVPILAQDEATSVVWGMPKFVVEEGLADEVLPLGQVAQRITARVTGRGVNTGLMRAANR